MRKITFDVETKNVFSDVGSNDPADLDMSVICIHDSLTDEYKSFLEEDLKNLWPILEQADMLVTFNGDHFDIPILNKYYPGDLLKIKSLDLLVEVRNSLGKRIKLDTLAEATLGRKKSGHGLEAITWWQNGEVDKVIKYCIEDVKITKELYEYALTNSKLKFRDFATKEIKDIKLNTSEWESKRDSNMTFTMPF